MTVARSRHSVWGALIESGSGGSGGTAASGGAAGSGDRAGSEGFDPAGARPRLREGVEGARLTDARGGRHVLLRSPDRRDARYLRLTPDEFALARLMDGARTTGRLVAEFARISGRLAPDQVTRLIADLAAGGMLDAGQAGALRRRPAARRRPGPRLLAAPVDPLITFLYRAGGRLVFTRAAAAVLAIAALAGLGLFAWAWALGGQAVFLAGGSYARGAAVLLGLTVLAGSGEELGRALAVKHAGRRVPAAGFGLRLGIPSVLVDTTDAWMAGRRGRLLTAAAGPAAGMLLGGLSQLVGALDPALAPWCFKLSFACYLTVAVDLTPLLPLAGQYLLADWVEVPNLRARGLAWIAAAPRRRRPRSRPDRPARPGVSGGAPRPGAVADREGRLVALYGVLCLAWLLVVAGLAYRVFRDRVAGLITGLWDAGWARRALLAAVVAGLVAPVLWAVLRWLGRICRRTGLRVAERRVEADAGRRYRALCGSVLGRLPVDALRRVAADARWLRPRTGTQVVPAGTGREPVLVVVDGALEGRGPGDPPGTVRHRVGPGGVVGLAQALTGAVPALSWRAAGATLLAVPAATVAEVAGPPPDRYPELAEVFDTAPALSGLSAEERLGLAAGARPVTVAPGGTLELSGDGDAAVIASGTLVTPDGTPLGPGSLIGPLVGAPAGPVAVARDPVRAWILPTREALPPAHAGSPGSAATGSFAAGYPPLTVPPTPPLAAPSGLPPAAHDDADRGFARGLRWLLLVLLLFGLVLAGTDLLPGPAWSEMPGDRALLAVRSGTVTATVDGERRVLRRGAQVYVSVADRIAVGDRARGRLTFRGGGYAVLCGGTRLSVGRLSSAGRPAVPVGSLSLSAGKLLAHTAGTSRAFRPLALRVSFVDGSYVDGGGPARYSVGWDGVRVASGAVTLEGDRVPATGQEPGCAAAAPVPAPGTGPGYPSSAAWRSAPPVASPSGSPRPSVPGPSGPVASGTGSAPGAPLGSHGAPTGRGTTRPPRNPPHTSAGPPQNRPPTIAWAKGGDPGGSLDTINGGNACNGGPTTLRYEVVVVDDHDPQAKLWVTLNWSGKHLLGAEKMVARGRTFTADLGPFTADQAGKGAGDTLSVSVIAFDSGHRARALLGRPVTVLSCPAKK